MTNIELAFLKFEDKVARKPSGRICRVVDVERPQRVKILDPHAASIFWVSWATAKDKWRKVGDGAKPR